MPEITEVEHVRRLCHKALVGHKITKVDAKLDPIVFCDVQPDEIENSLTGRKIVDTKRWGKYYVIMTDKGPHIVGHLGMTGWVYLDIKYKKPINGKEREMGCDCRYCNRRDTSHYWFERDWPPKFWKLQMTIDTPDAHITLVYDDVRRLGRIRLIEGDPMKCPPISKLGFDPLDKIPDLSEFTEMVQIRAVPIKALLLDQTFSAGVGNWVADEVLYHAKIHPAHYTNVLTDEECERLRDMIHYVCHTSAEVDADSNRFPEHWLFRYRWGKGKRDGKGLLPNGQKISYETVGGRTSAFVAEVQKLPKKSDQKEKTVTKKKTVRKVIKSKVKMEDDSTSNLRRSGRVKAKQEEDVITVGEPAPKTTTKRKRVSTKAKVVTKVEVKIETETETEAESRPVK